jgi:hypothetical protein
MTPLFLTFKHEKLQGCVRDCTRLFEQHPNLKFSAPPGACLASLRKRSSTLFTAEKDITAKERREKLFANLCGTFAHFAVRFFADADKR